MIKMSQQTETLFKGQRESSILLSETENWSRVPRYEFELEQNDLKCRKCRKNKSKIINLCVVIFLMSLVGIAVFFRGEIFSNGNLINIEINSSVINETTQGYENKTTDENVVEMEINETTLSFEHSTKIDTTMENEVQDKIDTTIKAFIETTTNFEDNDNETTLNLLTDTPTTTPDYKDLIESETETSNKNEDIFEVATTPGYDTQTKIIKLLESINEINSEHEHPDDVSKVIKDEITTPSSIIDHEDPNDDNNDYNDEPIEIPTTTKKPSIYAAHANFDKFPSKCGAQKSKPKIQHGKDAELFEHPWIVTLFHYDKTSDTETYFCGGSLISNKTILTAAHCFDNIEHSNIRVRLGEYNMSSEIDCSNISCADPPQNFNAADFTIVVHERYSNETGANDIALIKLLKPANISLSVAPVCLPFYDNEVPKKVEIIGFGRKFLENPSEVLMKGVVDLYDHEQCVKFYKNDKLVTGKHFCANKIIEGTKRNTTITTCSGDSGSPAVFSLNKVTQFGITTFGSNGYCGFKKKPGVFIKVSAYLDWILDNSG